MEAITEYSGLKQPFIIVQSGRGCGIYTLSSGTKAFDAEAIELGVKAHVRHKHTHYDQLLSNGWGRTEARSAVAEKLGQIVSEWNRKLPGKLPKAQPKTLIRLIGEAIMGRESDKIPGPVLQLSHGGGTLPLLGDKGHQNLINFIREVTVQNKHPLYQI